MHESDSDNSNDVIYLEYELNEHNNENFTCKKRKFDLDVNKSHPTEVRFESSKFHQLNENNLLFNSNKEILPSSNEFQEDTTLNFLSFSTKPKQINIPRQNSMKSSLCDQRDLDRPTHWRIPQTISKLPSSSKFTKTPPTQSIRLDGCKTMSSSGNFSYKYISPHEMKTPKQANLKANPKSFFTPSFLRQFGQIQKGIVL